MAALPLNLLRPDTSMFNALGENSARAFRGMAARKQDADEARSLNMFSSLATPTILPDMQWEGLKQALYESGADRVGGGASAAGSNQFRGQAVPIGGTVNAQNLPAGMTPDAYARSIESAASTGQMPSYAAGQLPRGQYETAQRIKSQMKGPQRGMSASHQALLDELARQGVR